VIKKERRLPTIFALLFVLFGIGATAYLVEDFQTLSSQAQPSIVPREVMITNLSAYGLTVSWLSGEKTQGFIALDENQNLSQTFFDERDGEKNLGQYYTHYVNIKNLNPDSLYYFKIISQGKSFDQNGFPYQVKTLPSFSGSLPETEPCYGTVLNRNNTPAEANIVYLTFKGALPLSALTKSSGNFLIPLNLAVRADLNGYFLPQEKEKEEITIRANLQEMATATADIDNDAPLPTIILGKSYDFRTEKESQSLAKSDFPLKVLGSEEVERGVAILFPKENLPLLDPKPVFKGTGFPREKVIIKIESAEIIEESVVVDPNGVWFFRPKKSLSPGKHSLTMTTKNDQGKEITLSREFYILESGSQVLGEATPSATLTPTPLATATPTVALTPTVTPTSVPITPTPSLIPGFTFPTISFLSFGILLFLIGGGTLFFVH